MSVAHGNMTNCLNYDDGVLTAYCKATDRKFYIVLN